MSVPDPLLDQGWIDQELAAEFPGLFILGCRAEARCGRSPRYIRDQLAHLSNRVVGDRAVTLRGEPVAHAYRVFFRHIGLDPDEARTPIEAIMLERLRRGRFASAGMPTDALTIAIVELGVGLCAFDARAVEGPIGLRLSRARERLGADPVEPPLQTGTIVLADERKALAPIFGVAARSATPDRSTTELALCAVGVDGVPQILAEEALWKCAKSLIESS